MTFKPENDDNDEISKLLAQMREAIVIKTFEYGAAREKKDPKLEDKLMELESLKDDFKNLVKMETDYQKYRKAGGKTNSSHSADFTLKMQAIQTAVGKIVSPIPKVD